MQVVRPMIVERTQTWHEVLREAEKAFAVACAIEFVAKLNRAGFAATTTTDVSVEAVRDGIHYEIEFSVGRESKDNPAVAVRTQGTYASAKVNPENRRFLDDYRSVARTPQKAAAEALKHIEHWHYHFQANHYTTEDPHA